MKTKKEIEAIMVLPVKEIAKQIRKDLKEKYGKIFKFSVQISKGIYTNTIRVGILKGNIDIISSDYMEAEIKSQETGLREDIEEVLRIVREGKTYTKKGKLLLDEVESIRNLYNYDNSDYTTDYSDKNYYGGVSFDGYEKV